MCTRLNDCPNVHRSCHCFVISPLFFCVLRLYTVISQSISNFGLHIFTFTFFGHEKARDWRLVLPLALSKRAHTLFREARKLLNYRIQKGFLIVTFLHPVILGVAQKRTVRLTSTNHSISKKPSIFLE